MTMLSILKSVTRQWRPTLTNPHVRYVYCCLHVSATAHVSSEQLVFLYKLIDGVAKGSFGTHVASIAGVPKEVVDRATVISTDFAAKFKQKIEGKVRSALPLPVQADFAYLAKLVQGMSLPDDKFRQHEVLNTIRQTAARFPKTV